jgi:hypothetical protein
MMPSRFMLISPACGTSGPASWSCTGTSYMYSVKSSF